jgi:phenylalanyl-tRNA synthetase beta chain
MPTILIDPKDFSELIGSPVDQSKFLKQMDLAKAELKGVDEEGRWRVELNDTNRPDLWSAEGIARQLRAAHGRRRDYPFFRSAPAGEILVDAALRDLRPYVAAFVVRGLTVTESSLVQMIQTQEKLAENYGRRRKDVAIGVYNLKKITFPIHYRAVNPNKHSYVPLGFEEPMTLSEILERHPKGIEYRGILAGMERVPLLRDDAGMTLSMPPIINSRELGEVIPGDSDLFVEATGTNLENVILALNIMACDMADRGGRIGRVRTMYPFDTPLGREVDVPCWLDKSLSIPLKEFTRLLGVPVQSGEVDNVLECYGCDVRTEGETVIVKPSPARADYLHPVDVVEDFAIARGYETFTPRMPRDFSIGRSDPLGDLEYKVRDHMIGLGYEEMISNILVAKHQLLEKMNLHEQPVVEVANVMNENYAVLRSSILPSLLQIESRSGTAAYPHCLFEAGEVAVFDRSSPHGSRTELHLGALTVRRESTLSEIHADLEFLFHQLGLELKLKEVEHPSFLPGRAALVLAAAQPQPVGMLGEVHPEVLERWEVGMPAAAFEIHLGALVSLT